MDTAELFDVLSRRPDIDAIDSRYRELLAAIRAALVEEIGVPAWLPSGGVVNHSTGRGPFARLGADCEIHRYTSGISPGAVSDVDWPRATAIVAELAGRHGFAAPTVVVDRPGDHEVSFSGEYGGELFFGTAVNTTLSLTTGCHLTREAYLRGPTVTVPEHAPLPNAPRARPFEPPAPTRPAPPRRRRPPEQIDDEDFDLMNFIRRRK